jgi:hypothetical protein
VAKTLARAHLVNVRPGQQLVEVSLGGGQRLVGRGETVARLLLGVAQSGTNRPFLAGPDARDSGDGKREAVHRLLVGVLGPHLLDQRRGVIGFGGGDLCISSAGLELSEVGGCSVHLGLHGA